MKKEVLIEIINVFEKYDISPNDAIDYLNKCKECIQAFMDDCIIENFKK